MLSNGNSSFHPFFRVNRFVGIETRQIVVSHVCINTITLTIIRPMNGFDEVLKTIVNRVSEILYLRTVVRNIKKKRIRFRKETNEMPQYIRHVRYAFSFDITLNTRTNNVHASHGIVIIRVAQLMQALMNIE